MPPKPSKHDGFARITADPARFWARVAIGAPDACWLWTGTRHQRGYGLVYFRRVGKLTSATASRVAYALSAGLDELPPGEQQVCHHCDNPPCCNPAHLFIGTSADNSADKVAKGRAASKISEEDVRAIIVSDEPASDLAKRFGVTADMVRKIRAGRSWSHVSRECARMPSPSPYARRLDADAVRAIRASDAPLAELAARFGVSVGAVSRVRTRATWKNVA